ncbi:MAG: ribosome small subunit-dependent GTPase A [Chloroflexi bacterium HGW-Chloroflexi-8]|jgi:ribosome biogenesis GTPase|nr:MAG: ribosome small subunit-dependent GTPase A [Chloroflexi bacterium HGW-Chloroflexi-8]
MNSTSLSRDGTIIFKSKSIFDVMVAQQIYACKISPFLERDFEKKTKFGSVKLGEIEWLTIGDLVRIESVDRDQWQITHLYPRKSLLSRRAALPSTFRLQEAQAIAANVDQMVIVFAITQPEIKWNLLDRYLIQAEACRLKALICFTKYDLVDSLPTQYRQELLTQMKNYQHLGYEMIQTSSNTGTGMKDLMQRLQGKSSIFLGKSGVGKTSLINGLFQGFQQRTNAVNPITGKGRHTTTTLSLLSIDANTGVIDTPGTREFGLWNVVADELAGYFPEMQPLLGKCKFRLDCLHDEEPGCAIRAAVVAGNISPFRYHSYLKLLREV